MWGDIQFGKPRTHNSESCSATIIQNLEIPQSVSQTSESFWVCNCILDIGFRAYKDTPQGKKIQELIDAGGKGKLSAYLNKIAVDAQSAPRLITLIRNEVKKSEAAGYKKCQSDTRVQLGLN